MNLEGRSAAAVEAQFEAAIIKAGFAELARREMAAAEAWLSEKGNAELTQAAFDANCPFLRRKFRREVRRRGIRRGLVRTVPIVGKVAVSVLLVFYLGLTVAVATIEQVRVGMYQFLIRVEDEYTNLTLINNADTSLRAPEGWEGAYYPSYIPAGLELTAMDQMTHWTSRRLTFRSGDGNRWVVFAECTNKEDVNINTEDADVSWREINGDSCMFVVRASERFAVWSKGDRYYWIWTDGACDELAEIVMNVKSVN